MQLIRGTFGRVGHHCRTKWADSGYQGGKGNGLGCRVETDELDELDGGEEDEEDSEDETIEMVLDEGAAEIDVVTVIIAPVWLSMTVMGMTPETLTVELLTVELFLTVDTLGAGKVNRLTMLSNGVIRPERVGVERLLFNCRAWSSSIVRG